MAWNPIVQRCASRKSQQRARQERYGLHSTGSRFITHLPFPLRNVLRCHERDVVFSRRGPPRRSRSRTSLRYLVFVVICCWHMRFSFTTCTASQRVGESETRPGMLRRISKMKRVGGLDKSSQYFSSFSLFFSCLSLFQVRTLGTAACLQILFFLLAVPVGRAGFPVCAVCF